MHSVHNNNRKAFRGEEQFFALFVLFALRSQKRASSVYNIMSGQIEVQYKASGGVARLHCSLFFTAYLNTVHKLKPGSVLQILDR